MQIFGFWPSWPLSCSATVVTQPHHESRACHQKSGGKTEPLFSQHPSVTSKPLLIPQQVMVRRRQSIMSPLSRRTHISMLLLPPLLRFLTPEPAQIHTSKPTWRTARKSRCSISTARTPRRARTSPVTMQSRLSGSQLHQGSASRPWIGSVRYTSWTTRHSGKERVSGSFCQVCRGVFNPQ